MSDLAIKIELLVDCMRRVERACGLQGAQRKSDEALETQAVEWLNHPLISIIPIEKYDDLTSWAIENRPNSTTGLTIQNILQAARVAISSGKIAVSERLPDPNCQRCGGQGAIFNIKSDGSTGLDTRPYRLRRDPITEKLTGEGYTAALVCECDRTRPARVTDPPLVGELMTLLPKLLGGPIPNPVRETEAARRLVAFGWSKFEILEFWELLDKRAERPPLYSDLLPKIGPHYFAGLIRQMPIAEDFKALAIRATIGG